MRKILFLAALVLAAYSADAQNLSGRDIIKKVKDNPDGDTRYAKMNLVLEKANGSKRERKVESWAMDIGTVFQRYREYFPPFLLWGVVLVLVAVSLQMMASRRLV